ncbi:MAG: hypothetical protein AAF985_27235, partial [Bacteroidota bacterium]
SSDVQFQNVGLKFGIQRRLFKRGFIDIQLGPELVFNQSENGLRGNYTALLFGSEVQLGIAFGKSTLKMDDAQYCDFFRCYQERKSMLKIDLFRLLSIRSFLGSGTSNVGQLRLAYEHKLGTSFSLNHELNSFYQLFTVPTVDNTFQMGFNISSQIRYYSQLKKRMATGKSANNLTGLYQALQIRTNNLFSYLNGGIYEEYNNVNFQGLLTLGALIGYQCNFLEKGFIDFTFGPEFYTFDPFNNDSGRVEFPLLNHKKGFTLGFIADLKIGFAF